MRRDVVIRVLVSSVLIPSIALAQKGSTSDGQRSVYGIAHDTVIERKDQSIIRPDEVNKFRKRALDNQAAMANPEYAFDGKPPAVKRKDVDYVMEAGRDPELLSMSKWVPASITFLDQNKKSIPVATLAWNKHIFSINGVGCSNAPHAPGQAGQESGGGSVQDEQGGLQNPTLLYIVPCRPSEWGGVSVQLKGYPVPVELIITASPKATHIDTPVVLNIRNPSLPVAKRVVKRISVPVDDGNGPAELWRFMSNTPPAGAVALHVKGSGKAWRYNGSTYIKAPGRLSEGNKATAEATVGQQTVYRFTGGIPSDVHFISPTGQDETIWIGAGKGK